MKNNTVWIVQDKLKYNPETRRKERVYDYTMAKEYGNLRFILSDEDSGMAQQPMILKLKRELFSFKEDDAVILVGDQSLTGAAMVIISQYNKQNVPVLFYEKYTKTYYKKIFRF
jgi:hypothetical protein